MMTEQEQSTFEQRINAGLNTLANQYPNRGFLIMALTNRDNQFAFYSTCRALRPSEMLVMLELLKSQVIQKMTPTAAQ